MPNIRRLGTLKERWLVDWVNQWPEFGTGYNWRNFTLIHIEFEDDRILGAIEFTFILLLLGVRIRHTYTITEKAKRLAASVDEIMKNGREIDDGPA